MSKLLLAAVSAFLAVFGSGCANSPTNSPPSQSGANAATLDCSSHIVLSPNTLKFGGLEIPLGKATPIKIASFSYGPEQVQSVSGAVISLDSHRTLVCQAISRLPANDPAYGTLLLQMVREETEVTIVSTILQTDPSRLPAWLDHQTEWLNRYVTDDQKRSDPKLAQAIQQFTVPNSHPGERTVGVTEKAGHWVLDADMGAGDCILKSGSFVDIDPATGQGHYSLTAYTKHTTSVDVWHQKWQVFDGSNNLIATIPPGMVDVGDLLNDHVQKTATGMFIFPQNAFATGAAKVVTWQGAC